MLAKTGFLIMDFLLALFILVAVRQVHAMHQIISDTSEATILTIFVYLLLIIAISLFLTGLVIL
jgi:hypothetical protein